MLRGQFFRKLSTAVNYTEIKFETQPKLIKSDYKPYFPIDTRYAIKQSPTELIALAPEKGIIAYRMHSEAFPMPMYIATRLMQEDPMAAIKLFYVFSKKHELVSHSVELDAFFKNTLGKPDDHSESTVMTMQHDESAMTKRILSVDDSMAGMTLDSGITLKRISARLGSNCGGTFVDTQTGKKYYIKYDQYSAETADRFQNEYLSIQLYQLFGVSTPIVKMIHFKNNGVQCVGVSSEWEEVMSLGETLDKQFGGRLPAVYPVYKYQTQTHFLIDALLANWDVVGSFKDNLFVTSYDEPFRLDTGGCLLYRAQGSLKGRLFDSTAREFETLTAKEINPQSHELFEDVYSSASLLDSLVHLKKVSDSQIKQCIDKHGFVDNDKNEKLYQILIRRKKSLIAKAVMTIYRRLLVTKQDDLQYNNMTY